MSAGRDTGSGREVAWVTVLGRRTELVVVESAQDGQKEREMALCECGWHQLLLNAKDVMLICATALCYC